MVLPDRAAWIATEVVLFSVIAIGMYVFLRALKLSTVACLLGAATFAFAGPVLGQVNHVDMTEGFAAIPWMLLAVHHIVRDGRWRWAIVLGDRLRDGDPRRGTRGDARRSAPRPRVRGHVGGTEPRALVAGGQPVCDGGGAGAVPGGDPVAARAWRRSAARNGASGSSRPTGSYPTPFSIFALVPYLDGGYGRLGEIGFFSQYNLPEVEIYLGVLPLIAIRDAAAPTLAEPARAA